MQIGLLVSPVARQTIASHPWLSRLDWVELGDVSRWPDCPVDLLVVEAPCLPHGFDLTTVRCPCWCFHAGLGAWDLPPQVEAFAAELDPEVLSARLIAWMWLFDALTPACFAGLSLSLTNGRLSFRTVEPSRYLMQMSVCPTAAVGGDVALYFESGSRTLVVLADAIGHGDEAALDAAQFVLGVVRYIVPSRLSRASIRQLCQALSQQVACGRFVAAAFIEFDCVSREIRLLNAGMPDVLCRQDHALSRYAATQPPLGLSHCTGSEVTVLPYPECSQWVLHSDGADHEAILSALSDPEPLMSASPSCRDAVRSALAFPLYKSGAVHDDASQVIVAIGDF